MTVDLTNCEREPVHIPGSIQPHGVLLVCNARSFAIEHVSVNIETQLGISPAEAIGRVAPGLFEVETTQDWKTLIAALTQAGDKRTKRVRTTEHAFDASFHRLSPDAFIVELESVPVGEEDVRVLPLDTVARFRSAATVEALSQAAADEVRRLTGYDRVMVYKFDADWHGEVIAEARREDLEPFLGLHYPASDIPAQARRLYTLNLLRIIADARYAPVPIQPPLLATGEPLDLSHAILRSVSPIHCEYLANMGVRASMSMSLLREGRLWGLIACHHYSGPKTLRPALRDAAEFLAQTLSWTISTREHADEVARQEATHRLEVELVREMSATPKFVDGLATPPLRHLTGSSGAAVVFEGEIRLVGVTPSADEVRALIDWMEPRITDDIFVTDQLARLSPPPVDSLDAVASGMLAVAISKEHREYVLWFRPSTERDVSWAGNPTKQIDPTSPRLSPRGSFSLWIESVRGRSLPWLPWEIRAASDLRKVILGGVRARAAELRALADRLGEDARAKDLFIAMVGHELRTPLNAIAGWSNLLRSKSLPGARADHALEVIERNAKAQAQLIEDLLDVSRMVTGKLTLEVQSVDLAAVVETCLESLTLSADAKNIRVRPVLDSRPTLIMGDPRRLQQVIWNLLANALKFTPKGGHIDVVLRRVSSDVELTITDNGIGIAPDVMESIFSPFQQGEARDRRGLGLGLAIARHIVELHGGTIRAHSDGTGMGSSFRVRLPVTAVQPASSSHPAAAPVGDVDAALLAGLRILVVEDEPDSRELMIELLSQRGAEVIATADAQGALAEIAKSPPDAIVSDVGLPGMDGLALMRAVRALPAAQGGAIPGVALTAFTSARHRTQALQAGFQSHVPKPVDAEELVTVLMAILQRTPIPAPR